MKSFHAVMLSWEWSIKFMNVTLFHEISAYWWLCNLELWTYCFPPLKMYCLQWLIPVLLIPKPIHPALLYNHAVFIFLYLLGFFLERKPCKPRRNHFNLVENISNKIILVSRLHLHFGNVQFCLTQLFNIFQFLLYSRYSLSLWLCSAIAIATGAWYGRVVTRKTLNNATSKREWDWPRLWLWSNLNTISIWPASDRLFIIFVSSVHCFIQVPLAQPQQLKFTSTFVQRCLRTSISL